MILSCPMLRLGSCKSAIAVHGRGRRGHLCPGSRGLIAAFNLHRRKGTMTMAKNRSKLVQICIEQTGTDHREFESPDSDDLDPRTSWEYRNRSSFSDIANFAMAANDVLPRDNVFSARSHEKKRQSTTAGISPGRVWVGFRCEADRPHLFDRPDGVYINDGSIDFKYAD